MRRAWLVLLTGCTLPPQFSPPPPPIPVSSPERVLLDQTYGEIGVRIGDALLPPDARVLVFAPPPAPPAAFSVHVRRTAATGEVVEAEIFVEGDPASLYRLDIEPDAPDVILESPRECEIRGNSSLLVRFTRTRPGKGGLAVRIRPVPGPDSP